MKGKTEKDQPDPLQYIKRKSNLKLLGITFEDNPTNWDTHFDYMFFSKLICNQVDPW